MARKAVKGSTTTKNALADALVRQLHDGKQLSKVRIRTITDACGVDRQTFYYYFANMQDLASYAYEREIKRLQEKSHVDGDNVDWRLKVTASLQEIQDNEDLRKAIVPNLGDELIRKQLFRSISTEVEKDFLPVLLEVGVPAETAQERSRFITFMLEAALLGWLSGEIQKDAAEVIGHVDEMLHDYIAGAKARYGKGE